MQKWKRSHSLEILTRLFSFARWKPFARLLRAHFGATDLYGGSNRVSVWSAAGDGGTYDGVPKLSFLDIGVSGRATLGVVFLAVQGALLATAGQRPDGVFSFQMFNESSTIAIQLGRRVATPDGGSAVVPIDGGWEAGDGRGGTHLFHWTDRVRDPTLATLGRPIHAAYGVAAQLFRLQHALDDVAVHLDGDVETRALVADVRIRRNGREPYETRLESRARYP